MSDGKKQKSNWRLWLERVVLTIVIVGTLGGVCFVVINRDKDWTGFGESTTKEESIERKNRISPIEKFTETTKYQSRKTLWDWLQLFGTLAVPILIAFFGHQFEQRNKREEARFETERAEKQAQLEKQRNEQAELEKERAEKQAELEREIAKNNLAEEAIKNYLDDMAKLLLDKELRKELFSYVELKSILDEQLRKELSTLSTNDKLNLLDRDNPVRDVARTQTITILRRLEGNKERQDRIIHFLRDAELYKFILKNANLSGINLSQANLEGANLQQAVLRGANLQQASLRGANLQGANLERANLQQASLRGANLQGANLERAKFQGAFLDEANLQQASLWGANLQQASLGRINLQQVALIGVNLKEAFLRGANLYKASLWRADLQQADLVIANLQQANLRETNLQQANLSVANLYKASLWGANLQQADLELALLLQADLVEAKNLTPKQIKSACFWEEAIYKGEWSREEETETWISNNEQAKQDNTNYIEELKKDKSSDPKEPVDCSRWIVIPPNTDKRESTRQTL